MRTTDYHNLKIGPQCCVLVNLCLVLFHLTGVCFTVPFNNMRTLKFKTQMIIRFFAKFNQMFSGSSQLPTTTERVVIKSFSTVQTLKQCLAAVGSWEELLNDWLMVGKKVHVFVSWVLNFRVSMLLKGAVKSFVSVYLFPQKDQITITVGEIW